MLEYEICQNNDPKCIKDLHKRLVADASDAADVVETAQIPTKKLVKKKSKTRSQK